MIQTAKIECDLARLMKEHGGEYGFDWTEVFTVE